MWNPNLKLYFLSSIFELKREVTILKLGFEGKIWVTMIKVYSEDNVEAIFLKK